METSLLVSLVSLGLAANQEANSEKTNNGIHYRLQLLYSNGEAPVGSVPAPWGSGSGQGAHGAPGGRKPPSEAQPSATLQVNRPLRNFILGSFSPEEAEGGLVSPGLTRGHLALTRPLGCPLYPLLEACVARPKFQVAWLLGFWGVGVGWREVGSGGVPDGSRQLQKGTSLGRESGQVGVGVPHLFSSSRAWRR